MRAEIIDCLPYDIAPFNEAARTGGVLIHCMELGEPHPTFSNVLLEGYEFPFSLVCPRPCEGAIREFAEALRARAAQDAQYTR